MFKMVFAAVPAVAVTVIPNASAWPAGAAMGGVGCGRVLNASG